MVTRVEKILSNARLTLADPRKERWDDETLVAILNEAQIDFCQQTQMLHERVNVPIVIGNPYFTLPDDCWMLTRALYENSVLPLVTHRELDGIDSDIRLPVAGTSWEVTKGEPQAIIYDRRNMLEGKIFPIPDTPLKDTSYNFVSTPSETFYNTQLYGVVTSVQNEDLLDTYGVVSALASLSEDTELETSYGVVSALTIADEVASPPKGFGILTDITDYTIDTTYGTLVNISDEDIVDTIEDVYGFVDTIVEACSFLTCYYLQNPSDLVDTTSELSIPQMYDTALKFYLCGQAFMNDIDTAYQQKGAAQMMIYERHVRNAKKDSSHAFTRAGQFETTYRRGF